jgi:hypothetical protein
VDWTLPQLEKVVATPHLAASTEEAQEQVGLDTVNAVRDYLKSGAVKNAVNFPAAVPADELARLQPWLKLAEGLASVASQMGPARVDQIGLRYYGGLAESSAASLLAPPRNAESRLPRRAARAPVTSPASSHSSSIRVTANAGSKGRSSNRAPRAWYRCAASTWMRRSQGRS